MRKPREVVHLRFELKLGYQQIGRSCAIAVSTVHKYLKRAEAASVGWPQQEDWDEALPDFAAIHEKRDSATVVGGIPASELGWLSLLALHTSAGAPNSDVLLRQEHEAGEKMFVDWAGATIPVYDRHSGQAWPASLFVAALSASSYTCAEATRDQQMEAWLQAQVHAFEHVGGIPALAIPDNTKTGVTRAHR